MHICDEEEFARRDAWVRSRRRAIARANFWLSLIQVLVFWVLAALAWLVFWGW
jgi:hypothetical protein